MEDREGDEADGKEEIICPYDFDWDLNHIKDDDFGRILKDLKKGVALKAILESCDSGMETEKGSWTGSSWRLLRAQSARARA